MPSRLVAAMGISLEATLPTEKRVRLISPSDQIAPASRAAAARSVAPERVA